MLDPETAASYLTALGTHGQPGRGVHMCSKIDLNLDLGCISCGTSSEVSHSNYRNDCAESSKSY